MYLLAKRQNSLYVVNIATSSDKGSKYYEIICSDADDFFYHDEIVILVELESIVPQIDNEHRGS